MGINGVWVSVPVAEAININYRNNADFEDENKKNIKMI